MMVDKRSQEIVLLELRDISLEDCDKIPGGVNLGFVVESTSPNTIVVNRIRSQMAVKQPGPEISADEATPVVYVPSHPGITTRRRSARITHTIREVSPSFKTNVLPSPTGLNAPNNMSKKSNQMYQDKTQKAQQMRPILTLPTPPVNSIQNVTQTTAQPVPQARRGRPPGSRTQINRKGITIPTYDPNSSILTDPMQTHNSSANAPSTSSLFQPLDLQMEIPQGLPESRTKQNSNKNYNSTNTIRQQSSPSEDNPSSVQPQSATYSRFPTNLSRARPTLITNMPQNSTRNMPNPAIFNPKSTLPYRPQIVNSNYALNTNFVPMAQPVNSALTDFIRLAQNLIPGIDSAELISRITTVPHAPINIPVPKGVDAASVEAKLQESLRLVMQQMIPNNVHTNHQAHIQNNFQNNIGMNNNLAQQQYINQIPQTSQINQPYQPTGQFFPNTVPNPNIYNNLAPGVLDPNIIDYSKFPLGPIPGNVYGTNIRPPNMNIAPINKPPIPPPKPSEDEIAEQDGDAGEPDDDGFQEVETYADYMPAKCNLGEPHPDPVVETNSLSAVEPPEITYELRMLDKAPKIVEQRRLSNLQLESVIYASQQHENFMSDGKTRKGFLIGDGAGVGKGRQIAGIIIENFLMGRKKAIWLSVSTDLKLDTERDFKDLGAKIPVYALTKFPYGKRIAADTGVIFTTYSGLVSKSQSYRGQLGSRIGQLITWAGPKFEGVIVFDECHKAKNISVSKTKKSQSKAAEFVLELQNRLPGARIVYASATGASETKHLGYMMRLGIWGVGTPYANFSDFCDSIDKGGVGAMELVAIDLKMRGAYIARQLSFKTTEFEIQECELSSEFKDLYDECVCLWSKALEFFSRAAEIFSGHKEVVVGYAHGRRIKVNIKSIWGIFWGAHQRFFKYLCIAAKVDKVEEIAKKALEDNMCVVIGLQSTGEAKTMEALKDDDISDFISTARATFESLIDNHFPAPESSRRVRASPVPSIATSPAPPVDSLDDQSDNKYVRKVSENEQKLMELAKKKQAEAKQKSSRQMRLERRKQELAGSKENKRAGSSKNSKKKHKTRIVVDNSSDTETSNPIAKFSSSEDLSTSSSTLKDEASDDDSFIVSDDHIDYSSTGSSSDEENEESDVDELLSTKTDSTEIFDKDIKSNAQGSSKKRVLESGSDSDVQITAVKKRQPAEIIFLDSDSDEDETDKELDDRYDPLKTHGNQLSEMRLELYNMIDKLGPRLPNNTLDDLIDRLGGPTKVAEMTGRKGHIIKDSDGQVSYKNRNDIDTREDLNVKEKERFMNGDKLIAIISEAASSGISLQADRRVNNKRRRVHITIELPWSADRAIQQFGRTHRSNQISGPKYVFAITNLAGEKRFASIVAKRLESLGALTHGDRKANREGRDLGEFNIAGKYCRQALEHLCHHIELSRGFSNLKPEYYKRKDGQLVNAGEKEFIKDARQAFIDCGLGHKSSYSELVCEPQTLQVNHFLNRLLGMRVDIQNAIFDFFTKIMDRLILHNKIRGEHDSGILELNADTGAVDVKKTEHFELKLCENEKIKCSLWSVFVERGISWQKSQELLQNPEESDSRNGYYMCPSLNSDRMMITLIIREKDKIDLFRCYKPNTGRALKSEFYSVIRDKMKPCNDERAKLLWERIYLVTDTQCSHLCFFNNCKRIEANMKCDIGLRHRKYCILSGGTLTAWPYLAKKLGEISRKLKIVRLKEENNRVIGPLIPQDKVDTVRRLLLKAQEEQVLF